MGNWLSSSSGEQAGADEYRAQARTYAQRRNELIGRSQEAWKLGNKGEAKALSNAAKEQGRMMAEANQQAAKLHFHKNNAARGEGELDLHGLFVKEAIEKVEQRIQLCKQTGRKNLVVIVGKGNHSRDGNAVLKPLVEKFMQEYGLSITVGKPNAGCIYVEFDKGQGLFWELIDSCVVM